MKFGPTYYFTYRQIIPTTIYYKIDHNICISTTIRNSTNLSLTFILLP